MGNANMQFSDFSSRLPYPCHLEHDSKAAADLELWNHPQLDSALVFLLNPNLGGAIITGHEVHQGNHMRSGLIEHICIDRTVQNATVAIMDVWKLIAPLML